MAMSCPVSDLVSYLNLRNPNQNCKLDSSIITRPVMPVSVFRTYMRLPALLTMADSLHLSLAS